MLIFRTMQERLTVQYLGLLTVVVSGNRKEVRVESRPTEPLLSVRQNWKRQA